MRKMTIFVRAFISLWGGSSGPTHFFLLVFFLFSICKHSFKHYTNWVGLEREVAGELVSPRVQVHLALPVEQDLDRPQAEVAAGLP
jgi:hypothetical protein